MPLRMKAMDLFMMFSRHFGSALFGADVTVLHLGGVTAPGAGNTAVTPPLTRRR